MKLGELARRIGGKLVGDPEVEVNGASPLEEQREGSVVWIESPKLLEKAEEGPAVAIIAPLSVKGSKKPLILVERPRLAFALALEVLYPARPLKPGIHPTAVIEKGATLGRDVSIMAYAYIGEGARIGDRAVIYPFCFVGPEAEVGEESVLFPGVVIYEKVKVGRRVRIHAGAVIGADGFGYVKDEGGRHRKIPQVGRVIIGDDVEIGANTCVDRATLGATVVGEGSKLDNLVQIGHNAVIGRNCVIVGQAGVSGSVTIEDEVVLAGQVGVADHVRIGKGAVIGAQAGVIGDVPAGAFYSGYLARPHSIQMRVEAAKMRLPQMVREVRELKARVEALERRLSSKGEEGER